MNDNTPTCNICNFNQHPLLCGRCTAHAVLGFQIKSVSVNEEIYTLHKQINEIIVGAEDKNSSSSKDQLHLSVAAAGRQLKAQKSFLELEKKQCLDRIEEVKAEMRAVREQLSTKRGELEARKAELIQLAVAKKSAVKTAPGTALAPEISTNDSNIEKNRDKTADVSSPKLSGGGSSSSNNGEKDYRYVNYKKIDLALRLLVKLNSLFLISIKRNNGNRRGSAGEREVFISFNPIPNLSNLVKYSHNLLNSSFERLGYFCFFVSNYLGLILPFAIHPPQRQQPLTVLVGKNGARFELKARDNIKKLIKERPKEFDNYAKCVSMLAINLLFLCLYTDVINLAHVNENSAIENNGSSSSSTKPGKYDPDKITKVALNVDENIYLLNIFLSNKNYHHHSRRQNPVHPLNANKDKAFDLPDLDDVWDLVMNKNYIEVNGNSGEWNLVWSILIFK